MKRTVLQASTTPGVASATSGAPDRPALLSCAEIARAFGETRALRSCSVAVAGGEVHAIMGENGSGKSTLVKILSGVLAPDGGTLAIDGAALNWIATPRAAQALGIATVFQEVLVVPGQTVLENIWLGADGDFRRRVSSTSKRRTAAEVLDELTGTGLDLDVPVGSLELSDRQVCTIVRALVRRPRLLILDESTSALDISTRDRLFDVVRRLCREGTAVIFISHRMDEIEAIADRITVLRSGQSVATLRREQASSAELLRLMSGSGPAGEAYERAVTPAATREVALRLAEVRLAPDTRPLDLEIRAGEIVGVAGLEGHGQERFVRVLAGVDQPLGGEVIREIDGRRHHIDSQRAAARLRVVYVPRDRKAEGIFEPLSILDNFSLPTLADDARFGLLRERHRRGRLDEYVQRLRVRLGGPSHRITTLSGGTQQKVLIARWLAVGPKVIVLNDPTRGVDIGTKGDIYRLLEGLAAEGVAIIVLSTELEEHIAVMDRVLVFREGNLFSVLSRQQLTRDRLVAAFFGKEG